MERSEDNISSKHSQNISHNKLSCSRSIDQASRVVSPVQGPITKPSIFIEPEFKAKLEENTKEKGQIIIHCTTNGGSSFFCKIRIWPETFLVPHESAQKAKLLYTENIAKYPEWQSIPFLQDHHFTLVFERLPDHCKNFDLVEVIPEEGGFIASNIQRNQSDVYHLTL